MQSLVIRPLVKSDLARHAAIMGNPAVVRYLYEEPLSLTQAEEHLSRRLVTGPAEQGEWRNFAVDLDGHLAGEVGFVLNSATHREAEVGYFFDPEFGGRGLATAAAATMVEWCFSELGAHRVVGRLDARNGHSGRLLERLGFTVEGRFRENEFVKGEWTDELVYAVLEHEWAVVRPTLVNLVPVMFHVKHSLGSD
jgi:RimJ/RimL family protein N-acetyltransferase